MRFNISSFVITWGIALDCLNYLAERQSDGTPSASRNPISERLRRCHAQLVRFAFVFRLVVVLVPASIVGAAILELVGVPRSMQPSIGMGLGSLAVIAFFDFIEYGTFRRRKNPEPHIAVGIRRLSDGLPADISVEDNIKLRALGWRTVRVTDNPNENGGMPVQHHVGSSSHVLNLLLKVGNAIKRIRKFFLQCF
jgi:hypothetical protein